MGIRVKMYLLTLLVKYVCRGANTLEGISGVARDKWMYEEVKKCIWEKG